MLPDSFKGKQNYNVVYTLNKNNNSIDLSTERLDFARPQIPLHPKPTSNNKTIKQIQPTANTNSYSNMYLQGNNFRKGSCSKNNSNHNNTTHNNYNNDKSKLLISRQPNKISVPQKASSISTSPIALEHSLTPKTIFNFTPQILSSVASTKESQKMMKSKSQKRLETPTKQYPSLNNTTMYNPNNTSCVYSTSDSYWQRRESATKERLNKIKNEKFQKEQNELQDRPKISKNSQRIVDRLRSKSTEKVFDRLSNGADIRKKQDEVRKIENEVNENHPPTINATSRSMQRTIDDLFQWKVQLDRKKTEVTNSNHLTNLRLGNPKTSERSQYILNERHPDYSHKRVEDRLIEQGERTKAKKNELKEHYIENVTCGINSPQYKMLTNPNTTSLTLKSNRYNNNPYKNVESRYNKIDYSKKNVNNSQEKINYSLGSSPSKNKNSVKSTSTSRKTNNYIKHRNEIMNNYTYNNDNIRTNTSYGEFSVPCNNEHTLSNAQKTRLTKMAFHNSSKSNSNTNDGMFENNTINTDKVNPIGARNVQYYPGAIPSQNNYRVINYDNDEHLMDIRKHLKTYYDNKQKQFAEENKNNKVNKPNEPKSINNNININKNKPIEKKEQPLDLEEDKINSQIPVHEPQNNYFFNPKTTHNYMNMNNNILNNKNNTNNFSYLNVEHSHNKANDFLNEPSSILLNNNNISNNNSVPETAIPPTRQNYNFDNNLLRALEKTGNNMNNNYGMNYNNKNKINLNPFDNENDCAQGNQKDDQFVIITNPSLQGDTVNEDKRLKDLEQLMNYASNLKYECKYNNNNNANNNMNNNNNVRSYNVSNFLTKNTYSYNN